METIIVLFAIFIAVGICYVFEVIKNAIEEKIWIKKFEEELKDGK